jgi:ATP-dependent Zn protease
MNIEKDFNERITQQKREYILSMIKYYILIFSIFIIGITMMFLYNNQKEENKMISMENREIYNKLINDNSTTSEKIEIIGISNLEEKLEEMESNGYIEDLKLENFFLSVGVLCLLISSFLFITIIILTFSIKNRMEGLW